MTEQPKTQWELKLETVLDEPPVDETWWVQPEEKKPSNFNPDGTIPWDHL